MSTEKGVLACGPFLSVGLATILTPASPLRLSISYHSVITQLNSFQSLVNDVIKP